MKVMLAGAGAIVLALGFGVWLAVSGDSKQTAAIAKRQPIIASPFNYDAASLSERRGWLTEAAGPIAKLFDRTLPKGEGNQPDMSVSGWAVDARRRAIELQIRVKGPFGVDKDSLPNAKSAMVEQVCPSYATSPIGKNRVTLVHTFLNQKGHEELSIEVNPLVCRAYM